MRLSGRLSARLEAESGRLRAGGRCELGHYGMDLVAQRATLFDVIGTLFTAVTYHELFKEAALNGNEKLEFGIQWQEVRRQLGAARTSRSATHPPEVTAH